MLAVGGLPVFNVVVVKFYKVQLPSFVDLRYSSYKYLTENNLNKYCWSGTVTLLSTNVAA